MRLKKTAAALITCLVVTAASANVAQANWEIEGVSFTAGSESLSINATSTVTIAMRLLETNIVLQATGLECSGTCSIKGGTREATGALKFTGVSFVTPASCSVSGGTITTEALKAEVITGPSGGTFVKFVPASGPTGTFAQIPMVGALCPLNGNTPKVKGSFTGRFSETGGLAVAQRLTFSPAEQTAGDPSGGLKLGAERMTLEAVTTNSLSGAHAGTKWGAN